MQWPQGDNMAASRPHNCIQSTDISFILSQTSVHGEVVLDRSDFVSKDNCPTNISEARGLCPPGPLPTVSSHFDPQWTDTSDLLLSKHTVILLLTLKKEKAFWKIFHYRKTMQSKVTQHKIEIFCITVRYDPEMMMDLTTENTFKNPVPIALPLPLCPTLKLPWGQEVTKYHRYMEKGSNQPLTSRLGQDERYLFCISALGI